MPNIQAGSFSRLDIYETCARRAEYAFIHRIPEPDRGPPPKGKTEWPDQRGQRVHGESEAFVLGAREAIPMEAQSFQTELEKLQEVYAEGRATTEQMWCFDDDWQSVGDRDFDNIRFRIKIDALVWQSPTHAIVIDYKTGKRYGNEVKHAQQLQLYALGVALKYPEVEYIVSELWYFDLDDLVRIEYTRKQALTFFQNWHERNQAMLNEQEFPANPTRDNCRFCPYGPQKSGDCPVGIQ